MKQQPTYSDFPLISSSPHSTFTVKSKSEVCSTSGSNFLKMSLYNQAAPYTGSDIPNNELPRSFAAGYLKGGSTTYNPIDSTVLAPVQFARVSYTLFPVLAPLHILISPLRFRALLLWQHNIHLSKIPPPHNFFFTCGHFANTSLAIMLFTLCIIAFIILQKCTKSYTNYKISLQFLYILLSRTHYPYMLYFLAIAAYCLFKVSYIFKISADSSLTCFMIRS